MNDLFFDEDGNDFDDLYGNFRPSDSAHRSKTAQTAAALPMTPTSFSYARSPGASSSVVSRSDMRDRVSSSASNSTDVASTDRRRRRRRAGSQELFDVPWQSHALVSNCSLCRAEFSLVRRKHHCRPCGRVMCSDCSSFLYFELSHRKHRVCLVCNQHLLAEQAAYDGNARLDQQEASLDENLSKDLRPSTVALTSVSIFSGARRDQRVTEMHGIDTQTDSVQEVASRMAARRKEAPKRHQESALFDSTEEDWFTDVPKHHVREPRDDNRTHGESTRPGWRARVKDTYQVTSVSKQMSVMTGSPLRAEVSGHGEIAEHFRYDDVGKPGLGPDNEFSRDMPRPTQESVKTAEAAYSVQSSRIFGKSCFADQFQYNVEGPGLGHDDHCVAAMPRPTDEFLVKAFRYDRIPRDKYKEMKPQESRRKKTLTQHESFRCSLPEQPKATMPRPTPMAPAPSTLYSNEIDDKRIVDDPQGFLNATKAEHEARCKSDEVELASGMARSHSSAVPSARRVSTSYSIVDHPSHTKTAPVPGRPRKPKVAKSEKKRGFTNALMRFFGVKAKPKPERKRTMTLPKAGNDPSAELPVLKSNTAEQLLPAESDSTQADNQLLVRPRHTMDYHGALRDGGFTFEDGQHPLTRNVESQDVCSPLIPLRNGVTKQAFQQAERERPRRDTFDDFFESPQTTMDGANASRRSTNGVREWAVRQSTSATTARFDQEGPKAELDGLFTGDESVSVQGATRPAKDSIEEWRTLAAMSLLDDQKHRTQSTQSGFTWSNVRSDPGFGTATYAVPTRLDFHASRKDASLLYNIPATHNAPRGTIMDDLKHGLTGAKWTEKDAVDDFFADFEEPNDYAFDSTTGAYVAARRAPVARRASRSIMPESPSPLALRDTNVDRHSNASFLRTQSKALSAASIDKEVADEVAEIIVDKISSLEDELAALKQLVCNRKGGRGSQKPRVGLNTVRPGADIFDNASSSDEDGTLIDVYTTSKRSKTRKESNQRPLNSKKTMKSRKDSFADLFEDESGTNGGTVSYEALFQTGTQSDEPSKDDDDTEGLIKVAKKKSKSRRPSSRTILAQPNVDRDEDLTLRGKQVSRQKAGKSGDHFRADYNSDKGLAMPLSVAIEPALKAGRKQAEEDDAIDALLDLSNDRDVAQLHGDRDRQKEEVDIFTAAVKAMPTSSGTSAQSSQVSVTTITDDNISHVSPTVVARVEAAQRSDRAVMYSADSNYLNEDKDFALNGTKPQETKPQTHKGGSNTSFSVDEGNPTEQMMHSVSVKATMVDSNAADQIIVTPANCESYKDFAPTSVGANAALTWLSVTTSEEVTIGLNHTDKEDLKHSGTQSKRMNPTNGEQDAIVALPALVSPTDEGTTSERCDDLAKHLQYKKSFLALPKESGTKYDTDFKSDDVHCLSVAFPLERDRDDDSESISDDLISFSFEIKTKTKCSSPSKEIKTPAIISNPPVLQVCQESPLSSSTTSVDENVKLGKYLSLKPSNRGSRDDSDDMSRDGTALLGEVELQAFHTDWQQMQAQEKERKKRLQVKQRQAQRDKILRKQGGSSKLLLSSAGPTGATKSKGRKKHKDKDDATSVAVQDKNSGSSRRRRHRENVIAEPLRSLTEL